MIDLVSSRQAGKTAAAHQMYLNQHKGVIHASDDGVWTTLQLGLTPITVHYTDKQGGLYMFGRIQGKLPFHDTIVHRGEHHGKDAELHEENTNRFDGDAGIPQD